MPVIADHRELRAAAELLRAAALDPSVSRTHAAVFFAVADWLDDVAHDAPYTTRRPDQQRAVNVAATVLDGRRGPEGSAAVSAPAPQQATRPEQRAA